MQLLLAVSQWRSLTIALQKTWEYVRLRNSLFTRPELSSVSNFLFTLDQDFYVGATQTYGLLSIYACVLYYGYS